MTVYVVNHIQDMRTPAWLYEVACKIANRGAPFALDAFASADNALCPRYYDEAADGLTQPWAKNTFCNAPFGLMAKAVGKAILEAEERQVETMIIGPAGCSQQWFHKLLGYADVYLPTQRLQFNNSDGTPSKRAMQDTALYHVTRCARRSPRVYVLRTPRAKEE